MKKLIQSGATLTLAVLLFFSFAAFKLQNSSRQKSICHECKKDSFKGVGLFDLMRDVARYNGTHVKLVQPTMASQTFQDLPSRSCTYTLDTLKKFICLIETYSRQAKITSDKLAIRFVYSVYPKKQIVYDQKYGSLHTLFMIPAVYDKESGVYVEFDPKATAERDPAYEQKLKKVQFQQHYPFYALSDLAQVAMADSTLQVFALDATAIRPRTPTSSRRYEAASVASMAAGMAPASYVWNQGMLCPPNCPTIDFLSTVDGYYPGGMGW